ncbi:MAG: hypothetical protein AABO58_13500 [Acidobacteriota bacterium]
MEPEFQRILVRVMVIGGVIAIVSAGMLFLAFRSFAGRGSRALLILGALVAFVLVVCAVLFQLR